MRSPRTDIALVGQHIERISGVSRTWLEWTYEESVWLKTLVVEVDFDTDPNAPDFRQSVLDAIAGTATGVLDEETTMVVSYLKIIPAIAR
jgi:hypothetical protein